jgi:hypothetical protein
MKKRRRKKSEKDKKPKLFGIGPKRKKEVFSLSGSSL